MRQLNHCRKLRLPALQFGAHKVVPSVQVTWTGKTCPAREIRAWAAINQHGVISVALNWVVEPWVNRDNMGRNCASIGGDGRTQATAVAAHRFKNDPWREALWVEVAIDAAKRLPKGQFLLADTMVQQTACGLFFVFAPLGHLDQDWKSMQPKCVSLTPIKKKAKP